MCKTRQEPRPGRYSCRQGFLRCCTERLLPAQARGEPLQLLASHILWKGVPMFWWLRMCAASGGRAGTWDQKEVRHCLLSEPSFQGLCFFLPSLLVTPSSKLFRNQIDPICFSDPPPPSPSKVFVMEVRKLSLTGIIDGNINPYPLSGVQVHTVYILNVRSLGPKIFTSRNAS